MILFILITIAHFTSPRLGSSLHGMPKKHAKYADGYGLHVESHKVLQTKELVEDDFFG